MNLDLMREVTLGIAGARATEGVLDQIVEGIADCEHVVLARIWLLREAGDDRETRRWLQLAASAGNPALDGVDPKRLDGRFSRFEVGDRKIGRVAATGEGFFLPDIENDTTWIADPAWAYAEGVRAFAAQPLVARGEILGVLAVFDRKEIPGEDFAWLRTFADHAALAITNARDFEEITELKARLEMENAYLRAERDADRGELIGASPAMEKVRQQIAMVAPTEASVLVLGESGVGKELVTHALHAGSERAKGPLVKVNCSAIPGDLFESEFFGHVQGSFTGALRDRPGRFELADGGTLFLDEVGEIPLEHQAKLLRVLQEGTYERVGEAEERRCDVRVIAATNRDLSTEVKEGRFRADLYYRLGVFPLEIPSLRERSGDVIELAEHFLANARHPDRPTAAAISARGRERLRSYAWPGNVRELQHVVERAVILARGEFLHFDELKGRAAAPAAPVEATKEESESLPSLDELKALEREIIRRAWEAAGRRVSGPQGAARALGLAPSTLSSRLKVLGLK